MAPLKSSATEASMAHTRSATIPARGPYVCPNVELAEAGDHDGTSGSDRTMCSQMSAEPFREAIGLGFEDARVFAHLKMLTPPGPTRNPAMIRTIPQRTALLRRATMPAITSTTAMIHRMVSKLPLFAASNPRASNMSPPLVLRQP
jgi:hypothetical protein